MNKVDFNKKARIDVNTVCGVIAGPGKEGDMSSVTCSFPLVGRCHPAES